MLLSRALLKRHSVLPGFDLALGFTLLYLSLIVLVPLVGGVPEDVHDDLAGVLGRRHRAARRRLVPADLRRLVRGGARQRGVRPARLLGARALRLPGAPRRRRAGRPAVRAADRGRRHRPDGALLRQRLDRPVAAVQGQLHAGRRLGRAHLHRPAVRRPHAAAGARGPAEGDRGGGGDPRREPLADLHAASSCRS